MSIKNRPTLITQFQNFINRIAPFAGDPLIQKSEHLQVITDHLQSMVLKDDESLAVATAGTMNLDASAADLFTIDTSGAGTASRTININNLEKGQRIRVKITKKTGDLFSVGSSTWWPIENSGGDVEQDGLLDFSFEAWNIDGVLRISTLKASIISDSRSSTSPFDMASSNAVKILNDRLDNELNGLNFKKVDIGDWNMDSTSSVNIDIDVVAAILGEDVVAIDVWIRNDAATSLRRLDLGDSVSPPTAPQGNWALGDTGSADNLTLTRLTGGDFDNVSYDDTPYNRGFIVITYLNP